MGRFAKYQKCLWDLMEKPDTSIAAKVPSLNYLITHYLIITIIILIFDDHSFDDNLDDTRPCHCLCLCCSYLSLSKDVSLSLLLYLWLRLYLCLYCSYLSLSQAVSFISFIFVVVSTVGMTLNTMPSMRHRYDQCHESQNWFSLFFLADKTKADCC